MTDVLQLEYYSDVLCVWAWIAERRNRELLSECAGQVTLHNRFVDLFSDCETRIGIGWATKGGYAGFGKHVRDAAAPYENAPVHADVWDKVRPTTSANAHLAIKAAELTVGVEAAADLTLHLREGFFVQARDIGQLDVVLEIVEESGLSRVALDQAIRSGRAIAALLADAKAAHENRVAGSPTWWMNNGRQMLYGNVGYRVLRANVEELLKRAEHEASWC